MESTTQIVLVLSLLISAAIASIFLYIVWVLEIYAISRIRLLLAAGGWGMAAFAVAWVIQSALLHGGMLTADQIRLVSAPVLEEILKASFLIGLSVCLALRYTADGAVYGFAVGTGFALVESIDYALGNPDQALGIVLSRVLSVNLLHASTTAFIGAVIGGSFYQGTRARRSYILLGLFLIMLLHAGFNQIVLTVKGFPLLALSVMIGLSAVGGIVFLVKRALRLESQSIQRELADHLSAGEMTAVANPQQIAQLLALHGQEIGEQRITLIERYLTLQAQRGVLLKTITLNQRPKFDPVLQRHLAGAEAQLQALQGSMGLYTWIWLRSVLPSDESELWDRLDAELQTDQPVLSLLITLNQRQQQISPEEWAYRQKLLRSSGPFRDLDDDDLEDLALLLQRRSLRDGDVVIRQDEANDHLHFVAEGRLIANVTDSEGMTTTIEAYVGNEMFGESSVFTSQPHPVTVVCADETILYTLSRADLLSLIYAKPQVAVEIIRQLTEDIRRQMTLLTWSRHQAALLLQVQQAQDNLSKGEVKTLAFLETAPEAIVITNATGQIVAVNTLAETLFGYTREEMVKSPIEMLLPERFRAVHVKHCRDYVANPRSRLMGIDLNLAGRRKDGSEFPVQVGLGAVQTAAGWLVMSSLRAAQK